MRLSLNSACIAVGMSGSTQQDARCHGVTSRVAERLAIEAGLHPYNVWPDMADHDLIDTQIPCVECETPFTPTRKGHVYCTTKCRNRRHSRERMRRLYQTDPDHRARRLAGRRALYAECADYEKARQRRYYYSSGEADRRRERYWSDPEYRELRIRQSRERRAALRESAA
jgi:hypothetical protein